MKRALVTGAGGMIGHWLVKYLRRKGYWVRGVDLKVPEWEHTQANEFLCPLDLRREQSCLTALANVDEVYHLAADMGGIGFIEKNKAQIVTNNTLINLNMLRATRVHKVKKFFFASSACVYPGYLQNDPKFNGDLKEELAYPADAEDGYGWEKLYMERNLRHYQQDYNLNVGVARFHNIYGPLGTYVGGREKAPAALCRKVAKSDGKIEVWGDGTQRRSYCHVKDCIEGIYLLMQSDYHDPINIGSDRIVSVNDMIDILERISGKKIERVYDTTKPQGVKTRNANISLARKVLKWEPQVPLELGLKELYWWINQRLSSAKG